MVGAKYLWETDMDHQGLTRATQVISLRGHHNEKETGYIWNPVHLVSRFNSNSDRSCL